MRFVFVFNPFTGPEGISHAPGGRCRDARGIHPARVFGMKRLKGGRGKWPGFENREKKQKWNKRLLSLNYLRIYRLFSATVLEKSTRLVLNFIYILSIDFAILGFCHFFTIKSNG